jgi:hypothetical protein
MRKLLFALLILLMAAPSFAGGGATMMMIGGGAAAAGGGGYVEEQSFTTAGGSTLLGQATGYQKAAQSFTADANYTLTKATIRIFRGGGTPTWDVTLYIYSDNTGAPGTVLTNGTSDTVSITGVANDPGTEYSFVFASGVSLVSGTTYHVVARASTVDGSNYCRMVFSATGTEDCNTTDDAESSWTNRDNTMTPYLITYSGSE